MGRRVFKIVATSGFFPLFRLIRKMIRAKRNLSLQILEYSTPCPKLKTQISISNSVGAKFSQWHLGINSFLVPTQIFVVIVPLAPRYYFLMAPTRIFLGIGNPRYSFSGILLCFPWHLVITYFWHQLRSSLELSCWHLRINSFCCQLRYF